jgi:hypothetical protein
MINKEQLKKLGLTDSEANDQMVMIVCCAKDGTQNNIVDTGKKIEELAVKIQGIRFGLGTSLIEANANGLESDLKALDFYLNHLTQLKNTLALINKEYLNK